MNRNEKQLVIESLKQNFQDSQAAFLVSVKGMPVNFVQGLRKSLHAKSGSKMLVAKNTLLIKAVKDIPALSGIEAYCKEQNALIFAKNQAPEVAKIILNLSKENEKLNFVAGFFDNKVLNASQVKAFALLPSKEVLLSKLCGSLNQIIAKLAVALNEVAKSKTENV